LKQGLFIETINTWYGKRWAIVDKAKNAVVESKHHLFTFPYTKEGHAECKTAYKELRGQN
jgi:hypothetical protein